MSRPHGRATVDPSSPRSFAVCDRCSRWYNLVDLKAQREWAGTTQIRLGVLVCYECLDELQPQLRTIILPPDPPPIINARTEPFSLDETNTELQYVDLASVELVGGGYIDLVNP